MVQLIGQHSTAGGNPEPLNVPDRLVQRYLDNGWSLAEGETFTPAATKSKARVLEVNHDLVPRSYEKGEDDGESTEYFGTGVDTGTELGANDAVRTPLVQDDGRKVDTSNIDGHNRPGLSGKSKEVLLGIAVEENVDLDGVADNKIEIKKAIEAHRANEGLQSIAESDDEESDESDTDED